jgi:hypothetical protein
MPDDCNDCDPQPHLSARLLCPSTILGVIMMGLTVLPMASCSNGNNDIVPARLAMEFAGFAKQPPPPVGERIVGFVSAIPLLFVFTWPYWTAVPVLAAMLILPISRRWATITWRLLLLAFSLTLITLMFEEQGHPIWIFVGSAGAIATMIWLGSSPAIRTLVRRLRGKPRTEVSEINLPLSFPLSGGFAVNVILCLVSLAFLGMNPELLWGGKLAAITNLLMAIVAFVSIRQARRDCNRLPRFTIADTLIASALVAISLRWLWA